MSQIVITADFHFGVQGRLRDILWAARVVDAYCVTQDIDTVLVLGDLLHDRQALGIDVLCSLYDFLVGVTRAGRRWITFPGNHDMFLKHSWELNGLRPLSSVLTVMEDVNLLELDEHRFWVLPFIHFERSYMRVLDRLETRRQEGDSLLTHIGVRGAALNTCFLLKDWSVVDFSLSGFERIYTGHFHSNQEMAGKLFYPGSPIPFKFDEGGVPHGFYVLDLDTMTHRFVDIWQAGSELLPADSPPPQYHTVLEEQLHELGPEIARGNMVRVVHHAQLPQDRRCEIKEHLATLGVAGVRWMGLSAHQTVIAHPTTGQALASPAELFRRWLAQDLEGTKGLDMKLLLRFDAEVRQEGDERYVYAQDD